MGSYRHTSPLRIRHFVIMMTLTVELPPPLNATYRMGHGMMYKTKEMKDWQEMVGWEYKRHHTSLRWLTDPLYVGITMFLKRDRDIDSSLKGVLDALQGIVYTNDKQIVHLNVRKEVDVKNPRLEIEIESMKV